MKASKGHSWILDIVSVMLYHHWRGSQRRRDGSRRGRSAALCFRSKASEKEEGGDPFQMFAFSREK